MEEAEIMFYEAHDYECLAERLDQQELLKALDFCDALGDNMRIYNVCTAYTHDWDNLNGRQKQCGLAYPAKMWKQEQTSQGSKKWAFYCKCDWSELKKYALANPKHKEVQRWWVELSKKFGENVELDAYGNYGNWPQVGCKAKFVPYKTGPNIVV